MLDRSYELAALAQQQQQQQQQHQLQGGNGVRRRRSEGEAERRQREAFVRGSEYLARELDTLSSLVSTFVGDSKRRGLHEGSGVSLARSSDEIKKKMDVVLKGMDGLKKIIEGSSSRQLSEHFRIILDTLQKRFKGLTKTFQHSLESRTKALSDKQAQQVKQFGAAKVQLSAPRIPRNRSFDNNRNSDGRGYQATFSGGIRRRMGAETQQQQFNPKLQTYGPPPPSVMRNSSYQPHLDIQDGTQEQPQQFGMRQRMQYDRSAIRDERRAMEMQNIEAMVTEVSQMFGRMATLVAEQGEVVERIDENLDVAGVEISGGQSELLKYYNNLTQERAFILKIFAVVITLSSFFIWWWR